MGPDSVPGRVGSMIRRSRSAMLMVALMSGSFTLACGGDGNGGGRAPTCEDACSRVAMLCGGAPANCATACATLTEAQRSCVEGATTCAAANACGMPGPGGSDGGPPFMSDSGMSDSGPARCTNGYQVDEGGCVGADFNTFEGCGSRSGALIAVTMACGGDRPNCLQAGTEPGVRRAGCCPAEVVTYDPARCRGAE